MIDGDETDDGQAALIDRRIGQALAFARVAVTDPDVMDVFADGSDLRINDIVPKYVLVSSSPAAGGACGPWRPWAVLAGARWAPCDARPATTAAPRR